MLTVAEGRSSMDFPCQKPTWVQYTLWQGAVGSITISGTRLRIPLGAYTVAPHRPDEWFTNVDGSQIYHTPATGTPEVYECPGSQRATRYGSTYFLTDPPIGDSTLTHRVSIRLWNGSTLRYHSATPRWVPRPIWVPHTLHNNLASWGNDSLWTNLRINGEDFE